MGDFFADIDCKCVEDCPCIKRVIYHFHQQQTERDGDNNHELVAYCDKHKTLLNDHIHLVEAHTENHDLLKISKLLRDEDRFKDCNIETCHFVLRYYQNNKIKNTTNQFEDKEYIF